MFHKSVSILIISDCERQALCLVESLLEMGFAARANFSLEGDVRQEGTWDIVVVLGTFGKGGRRRLPPLGHLDAGRLMVCLNDPRPEEFGELERAGIEFVGSAQSTDADTIVRFISQVDPDLLYAVSRTQVLTAEKSKVIDNGAFDFFKSLRDREACPDRFGGAPRRAVGEGGAVSPMSVWIDLFQNYHDVTAQHCSLVSGFALLFARSLGFGLRDTGRIYDAAFFHDVGKSMIPLEVLDKPARLDEHEWALMKRHALFGYDILMRNEATAGEIARVARDHHEYLDGSGYPYGIGAAEIDDPTRIVTICDIFSALVEKRVYKPAKTPDEAFDIVKSMAGTKLDLDLVRLFERVADDYDVAKRCASAPNAS